MRVKTLRNTQGDRRGFCFLPKILGSTSNVANGCLFFEGRKEGQPMDTMPPVCPICTSKEYL